MPILAALIVSVVGATLITILSQLGIPASLAVSTTMCIIGLGWGRASRTVTLSDVTKAAIYGEGESHLSAGALATGGGGVESQPTVGTLAADESPMSDGETGSPEVQRIGEGDPEALVGTDLFDPAATARVITLWVLTPTISAVASYLVFEFVLLGWS